MKKAVTVDQYISTSEGDTRKRLVEIRDLVKKSLPNAEERISYAIPAFWDKGYIVYFAGYEKHVSMYPVHNAKEVFGKELEQYLSGKATARFPVAEPLPTKLIKDIIAYLSEENKKRKKK